MSLTYLQYYKYWTEIAKDICIDNWVHRLLGLQEKEKWIFK